MAVKSNTGMRVNYLIIFLSGLVLLVAAILVFLLVIKNIYGRYEVEEILPTKKNLGITTAANSNKIAILYSRYTENMLPSGSTWLSDNIDTWEKFLSARKYPYSIITDQDIELGRHFGYKIIVLPGSKSLSDRELLQIRKYLEEGGSLFSTGGPATFSDETKWRGWQFFTEVFGLKFTKEIDPKLDKRKIHTLRGNVPITAGIPTGYALNIATWDRPIYAEIVEPRTTQVSFWFDFRKESGLVREQIRKSAGIAFGTYGKGRFVWYGFEINSVIGKQEDYIYFERLFNNSIRWLSYLPTGFVKDWPAPYEGAMLLITTIGDSPANAGNINRVVKSTGIPATIFADPYKIKNYPGVLRSVKNDADLGAIVDIGYLESATDTLNKLEDKETQFGAVEFAVDTFRSIAGKAPKAIMPSYGFYDENTLQAMSLNDINFLITDSLTDRSVPMVEYRNGKPMLIITKTARDDKQVIKDYGLTDKEFQSYTYDEDVDRLIFEGGLYVWKVHTGFQLRPEYASVLTDVVNYAKEKKMWMPTLDQLRSWWLRRGGIEMTYQTRSKRRVSVEVSNPTDEMIEQFVVELNLNKKVKDIEISSEIINTKIPRYEFDEGTYTLYIYIDELQPGESRSYLVDFENIAS